MDAKSARWAGAVWIPVWHFSDVPSPIGHIDDSEDVVAPLKWKQIVLYDVADGEPLVLYDMEGGLIDGLPSPLAERGSAATDKDMASFARRHFSFLHADWRFSLNRHAGESGTSGCLHLDPQGQQRMEMLGVHARGRNMNTPPDAVRPGLAVANPKGDLDAYVVQHDAPDRFSTGLKYLWGTLSVRMHDMLPSASAGMVDALEQARVRDRLYSEAAHHATSGDLLVNNVGVSAAYQSPPHFDVGDIGWTFAFACKCGPCGQKPARVGVGGARMG